jgi:hypothetical protein
MQQQQQQQQQQKCQESFSCSHAAVWQVETLPTEVLGQ